MTERTFLWGGGSSSMRRATELGGRRRHDQQRLLVELELDDSLYQNSQRVGMENNTIHPGERRSTCVGDSRHSRRRSNGQHCTVESKQSVPRHPRDTAAKPLTERQMQQLHARRLSSPYKLKQEVLGTRNDRISQRHHQRSSHSASTGSLQRMMRSSSLQQTPAGIVIESIQQNIHLRDQVMAHLQQELMGVLPLHRASHVEKNVPQRVVKLLNRMRSLSLAVVEAVVYLSNELGTNMIGASVEHDILERDFYGYLLQMTSSDTDFLAYSPPLQRFFEDFEVKLTRNPFVDGLSLDSSEVLLCSCHQNASSDVLFGSASSSSSSLMRLLTHKLETFSLQTQRYLPGWQILPAERVAAALLHLMDLETRFNAVQMLPRYLQSHSGYRRHLNRPIQQRHELEGDYGTFGGDIAQNLGRQDTQLSRSDHDLPDGISVMEAWAGSPTVKSSTDIKSLSSRVLGAAVSSQPSLAQTSGDRARMLLSSVSREARGLSPRDETRKPSLPSQAWVPPTSSTDLASARVNTFVEPSGSSLPSTTRRMSGADVENKEPTQLELPVAMGDMTAAAKSSSTDNSSERTVSEKKSRNVKAKHNSVADVGVQMSVRNTSTDAVDVGIQMTQRNTVTVGISQTTNRSMTSTSTRSLYDEVRDEDSVTVEKNVPSGIPTSQPSTATATATQTTDRSTIIISARSKQDEGTKGRDGTARNLSVSLSQPEIDTANTSPRSPTLMPEINIPESLELVDHLSSVRSDDLLVLNGVEPAFLVPSLVKPLVLSRAAMEGDNCALGGPTTANQTEQGNEDTYECDFEYSSNEVLSSIAKALQMLPDLSLSTPESALVDDILKPGESISPIETASLMPTRTQELLMDLTNNVQVSTPIQMLLEENVSMERAVTEPERAKQSEETPPLEDEFSYSSTSVISNIAMALSLLPGVSRDDIFSVPEDQELETPMDVRSPRISTYRSIIARLEDSSTGASELFMEETLEYGAPVSTRSTVLGNVTDQQIFPVPPTFLSFDHSATSARSENLPPVSSRTVSVANCQEMILCEIPVAANREMEHSVPASTRSAISVATSYHGDDESEQPEFNRIFELCRDIQGTAFGMSHWVSQREVEHQIQSFSQPYSSLMGYASPVKTNSTPKYLERELKMLRRNFAWWKVWVVDHKRAKVVVRRLVARRKVRQFVNFHHWRRLQARIKEENDRRFHAVSRIQRNWRICRYKRDVSARKYAFRIIHMTFYRAKFYVGILKRRYRREYAKEKVVRWWRHQRYCINKKKQRLDKLSRERERRARALREIQKFLKEILLRRRLKAAQEMAKNILFKEQLKWTKAKRDVEKGMKLNSKHKKELIADMDAKLAELDRKWKAAEEERLRLLSHHDRVVQQQQQAVEVRRRRLAALKLQMFFRVCHLHKKLYKAEAQKQQYQIRLQDELLMKQHRDFETQKRISQSRTQARVLERKLNRLAQEVAKADTAHHEVIQAHLAREIIAQERHARQKIKAFIDARTLCRRADTERRRLVLEQVRIQAEKTEIELMACEEQREQRRTAVGTAFELQQRLNDMEARSDNLQAAKDQLALEKEEERRRVAEVLEQRRVEVSMHHITSWVSEQMQLSRLKKEQAAITALAARELEEEKQKHRSSNEAKIREIASIKASNLLHQRTSQHRNQKTVEAIRIQHQQKTAQEKVVAACTRAQLVQLIIDVKLLTEQESTKGIRQGIVGVAQFYKIQLHKFARLKLLRRNLCARKIQRTWRQWIHIKRVESAQQLALIILDDGKQRQASARRAQAWWRKWTQEQRSRREQKHIFDKHVESIRLRANARKIQGVWRRWVQLQQERRHQQQLAFDKHLDVVRIRANVRRIQAIWRRWVERERDRRRQQQLEFKTHLEQVRTRASVRKIQGVWKRWTERERERRIQQQLAVEARLEVIRARANVCKIQRVWRRWSLRERERRAEQLLAFTKHIEEIRLKANARIIQREWRRWIQGERARRHVQRLAFKAQLKVVHMRAMIRKIQRVWRCWSKAESERRQQQQLAFNEKIQSIRDQANVRKIQAAWRRWAKRIQDRRRDHRFVFFHTLRIQRWWRKWQKKQRMKATRNRIMQNACAHVIQKKWKSWYRWQRTKRERRSLRIQRGVCARRLQNHWRQWRNWKRRREASAARIQRRWEKWQKMKLRETRAVEKIQRLWRRWHKKSLEREREEKRQVALKIQQNWTGKLFRRNKEQADRKRSLDEQQITQLENERQNLLKQDHDRRNNATLAIQKQWRKIKQLEAATYSLQQHACASKIQELWQTHRASIRGLGNKENLQEKTGENFQREEIRLNQEELEEQARETQHASSLKIQRNWGIRQHRRKMERQRVQHEQHMAALKIQTLWLKWHHEQEEELERERIRQEQDESSFKIERNWGMTQQRRRLSQERLRHRQNISALKIQKHWRRWQNLRLEQRTANKIASSITIDLEQLERAEKLEIITRRSYGRRVARTMKKYHQNQREHSAATKIEAIWRGKLYRKHYLEALDMKHDEEARQYRHLVSVLATKVQICWRQWQVGIRQAKRAIVKSEELRLIQEARALEKKLLAAKRTLAAKRIQRALASRRRLIATKGVSHREVVTAAPVDDIDSIDKVDEEDHVNQPQNEEAIPNVQEPKPEEELMRSTVEMTVDDWGHRQLPHILSRSVNQILFCHEAASVIQKCIRSYLRRLQMIFYFKRSFVTTGEGVRTEHFNFYFKKARGWLDWDKSKSNRNSQNVCLLRLRLDSQMTRKLLQVFEPSEEYTASESHQVLQEIAADVFPILQSPACVEDNENSMSELRYHDVEEMELPLSVKLLRQMEMHRAYLNRQVLLEVDTTCKDPSMSLSVSLPSSPIGKSASSSPSQRVKKEMTIFTAIENASVEDATFLQQRGFDLGALEAKTQRNALHMLSFSKETYRSRAEMLEFLLNCGANLNVNAVDCNGDTPSMIYASLGHLEFMKKLLQHGADLQLTNNKGQNVLHRACEADQVEICGFLQQLMMKDSIAEIGLPVETISSLVPVALSLHTPDVGGQYPLHYLAGKGFIECAKQLLVSTETNFEWNRNLQAQGDVEGRTALHLAVLTHDVAMTAYLLTPGGGSDANCFDDLHRSPLHYAVESPAALPIISRLVQHGANLNVADERGDTPLHWAAFSGRAIVMQNLLTLGADPTLRNSDWENPAQIAAAYGQLDCMRLLVQAQRRIGASQTEPRAQQQPVLNRPASEKTALERLAEAVDHLHQKQASAHSMRGDHDAELNPKEHVAVAEQSHGGYWEELHQDVQLVEESGQFSSEDEDDLLFGADDDPGF